MEISPVSITQIALGRDGRQYEITGEAGRIAKRLQEIDPTLRVEFNDRGMFFVVVQMLDRGSNATADELSCVRRSLVMRVPMDQWDDRVVREWQMRAHELRHGRSAADRLDADQDAMKAQAEYELDQTARERAYPLFRAFQRNLLGQNPRAFIRSRRAAA